MDDSLEVEKPESGLPTASKQVLQNSTITFCKWIWNGAERVIHMEGYLP